MYKYDINKLLLEKRQYKHYLLHEYLIIYFNLLLFINGSANLRKDLTNFVLAYLSYDNLEKDILLNIKKYFGKYECVDECEKILEMLDETFFKYFNYNEYILSGYYATILTENICCANVSKPQFPIIDENEKNKIINKIMKKN